MICADKETAEKLFDELRARGHYSGKWYRPIPFPDAKDPTLYEYDATRYPKAEDISARILNLPTNISTDEAKEIADVLHHTTN